MKFSEMTPEQRSEMAKRGQVAMRANREIARKPKCKRGHLLEGDNVIERKQLRHNPDGDTYYTTHISCRECRRLRGIEQNRRQRYARLDAKLKRR